MKIEEARTLANVLRNLHPLARSLRAIYERKCNGYHSQLAELRAEVRLTKLQKLADEWAALAGLTCYHQTDPRGVAIYLLDPSWKKPDSSYTSGIAIH